MTPPEGQARQLIDRQLENAGWLVQDWDEMNIHAGPGVAVREFRLKRGHGFADYLLFVDQCAVGVLEAKKVGFPLTGVEVQAQKYSQGLPDVLDAPLDPLPFCYLATGVITKFTNHLDPDPRSRTIFHFHQPQTLREWLAMKTLHQWVEPLSSQGGLFTAAENTKPSSLRARLQTLPELEPSFLYDNQVCAVTNLEASLKRNKPRALIQMATGSGKTIMAVTACYRLIKYAGARRVLFLVDRGNLAEQAEDEFAGYRTPDDHRKFTDLYNVQRLKNPVIASSSKVVISTIQRFYSMLKGEPEYDEERDEQSLFEADETALPKEPLPVVYNPALPPEFFDVIVIDECHRSIYSLWRQVLEYFDAFLVGLTATPAKHTFGFFNQNLVMEYSHEEAVADRVNVDFEIYKIRTKITAEGSVVPVEDDTVVGVRDRLTRELRWERPDQDLSYSAAQLDRDVVAEDQIRVTVQTFRDKLKEMFPHHTEVPKTLVFAKDDSHAEDIVKHIRLEFDRGNDFCQKITYKTTGRKPADLIQDFRTGYYPRIAVTVDMIATGTDIKPVEVVIFMRAVKSRVLYEQMKGRGVRTIDPTELAAVTPNTKGKTHFVIVDCVGVTESPLVDTQPLERKKSIAFKSLLEHVAMGGADPDMLASLASRLSRLDKLLQPPQRARIRDMADGVDLADICRGIVTALDPDQQIHKARLDHGLSADTQPDETQIKAARKALLKAAVKPLAARPKLRKHIIEVKTSFEQIIDHLSKDTLISAGFSEDPRDRANTLVQNFRTFIQENQAEIDALAFFYGTPYKQRLKYDDIKAIHEAITAPPRAWTPEKLWDAYQTVEANRVRGASAERRLVDIVSLIRFALERDDELAPFADKVAERFNGWMIQQRNSSRNFTADQEQWLVMIRDHVAQSLEIEMDDFGYTPFVEAGGLGKAVQLFGRDLRPLLDELNEVLAG